MRNVKIDFTLLSALFFGCLTLLAGLFIVIPRSLVNDVHAGLVRIESPNQIQRGTYMNDTYIVTVYSVIADLLKTCHPEPVGDPVRRSLSYSLMFARLHKMLDIILARWIFTTLRNFPHL